MRSCIRMYSRVSSVVVVAAAVSLVLIGALPARAQVVFASTDGAMGHEMSPPVTSRELARYADLLGLSDEQRATAEAMWEGFEAQFQEAARTMQEQMDELRAEFEDTQDIQVMLEGMGPIQRTMRETSERLRDELFSDLKLLLDDEQAGRWADVERTRRRERTLRSGQFSGESVDLVAMVADLDLNTDAVAPVLSQYELDLDRALIERNAAQEAQREYLMSKAQGGSGFMRMGIDTNDEEFASLQDKARDASVRVRDLNRRYVRQVQAVLSPDDAASFEAEYRARSFPNIYRETYVSRALDAALRFEDLDAEQRETLSAILDSYNREVSGVNDRWASATEEMEENSSSMAFSVGGMERTVRISDSADADDPVDSARRARRDLDRRTLDRVRSLLTEQQRARLPERRRERPQRFTTGGGDGMWVEHVEIVVDDDGNEGEDVEIRPGGGGQ